MVFHFAGHAEQRPPSQGGAALYRGDAEDPDGAPLTTTDIAGLRWRCAELAVLWACETALGFRHVIATLWPVSDTRAPQATDRFSGPLGTAPSLSSCASPGRRARPDGRSGRTG
ncbi:CHAT domain-containing protein [Streptomyces sp. NPDC046832]|uniref:CHAT domain-containing protein n=1 Tax=Streptomyces sp. NPDC046832 TaxID=3155020 RepID=UPI003402A6C0